MDDRYLGTISDYRALMAVICHMHKSRPREVIICYVCREEKQLKKKKP